MSGNGRLNRMLKPPRLIPTGPSLREYILLVLFAAAGIVVTLAFSHFDTSMPMQLLAP
jgi:hypothetical protein